MESASAFSSKAPKHFLKFLFIWLNQVLDAATRSLIAACELLVAVCGI